MNLTREPNDELLDRIVAGNASAADELLQQYRARLVNMVRLRLDRRVSARLDASDIVQDALIEAYRKLPLFAESRPMPFYPWLRGIAWERVIQLHREHVGAQRRSVVREQFSFPLPEESEMILAERLARTEPGVTTNLLQAELRSRIGAALEQVSPVSREVIVLRHLEELPFKHIEAVLGIGEAAVYSRYRRGIEQLARLLRSDQ